MLVRCFSFKAFILSFILSSFLSPFSDISTLLAIQQTKSFLLLQTIHSILILIPAFTSTERAIYTYSISSTIIINSPSLSTPSKRPHLLPFPTPRPIFLSTYQFHPFHNSLLVHIHSDSSSLAILFPDNSYPDFVATFCPIFVSKPVLVCSILYSNSISFTLPHDAITSVESPICGLHATSRTRSLCPLSFDSNSQPFSNECTHLFLVTLYYYYSHSIMCT